MKFFFIVHSSIAWLVVDRILKTEQFDLKKCTILTDRRMPVPTGAYRVLDISELELRDLRWREAKEMLTNRQQNRNHIQVIDNIISELCPQGESFQLYLPHHRDFRYWAFTTHAQCAQFFYTEEGTMSYWGTRPHPTIPQYTSWKWRAKRFILMLAHDWYLLGRAPALLGSFYPDHPKYGGAYGLSELSFPGLPNVNVLPLPFQYSPEWAQVQRVLVFGPYVEFGEMPQSVRLKLTRELFSYFVNKNIKNIYLKFHPAQYNHPQNLEQLKKIIQEYSDRIDFQEIPQSVSLENIAFSSKADFYLITSSVAIYALLCGSRVISYARSAVKYHPPFQKTLDAVPRNVWEKIEFIEF